MRQNSPKAAFLTSDDNKIIEVLRDGQNWPKKLIFCSFWEVFCLRPRTPYEIHPKILPIDRPYLEIYVVSFISKACVVVKSKVFKFFLYQFSIRKMAAFWVFLGPYSPKYCFILLKLWPEVVSNKKNSVWKILQTLEFYFKWNAVKVYSFGPYWGPIYHRKTKNIAKNQNFFKISSLGIINNVSPRFQKNHKLLVKLSQKTFSGPKLGLNYHHELKGHHKFSHSL